MNIYHHNPVHERPFSTSDVCSGMILSSSELSDLLDFIVPNNFNPIDFRSSPIPLPVVSRQTTFNFETNSPSIRTEFVISHNMHVLTYNALPLFDSTSTCFDPIPFSPKDPKHDVLPLEVLSEVFALSLPEKQQKLHQLKTKAKCEVDGCNTLKQSNGKCIRHGGGKRCTVEGCTRGAQTKGRCKRHGGGARCQVVGCTASSQGGGLCRTHGGGKICTAPGCKKGAQLQGKCATHTVRLCGVEDCFRSSRCRGFCGRHKMLAEA